MQMHVCGYPPCIFLSILDDLVDSVATTAISAMHAASASSLDTWSMGQRTLQLHHGTRDLVTDGSLSSLVVDWSGGVMSVVSGGVVVATSSGGGTGWVSGGGRLDGSAVGVAATESRHEGWLGGLGDGGTVTS